MTEPLFLKMKSMSEYTLEEGQNNAYIVFADDITLLADNIETAKRLVQCVEKFIASLGMSPTKSITIAMKAGCKDGTSKIPA